jgi:hypothetical protein
MRLSAALCLFFVASSVGPASGATHPLGHAQPAKSSPPTAPLHVEIQKQAGSVEFFAVGWPSALKIHGKGLGPEGDLEVVGNKLHGALEFDLATLETGIDLRDKHMKEQYLQTSLFPRAVLTLEHVDVEALADRSAASVSLPFRGTLALHGDAKVTQAGSRVGTIATFTIVLGDFGIAVPKYLGITVAEKVQVKVSFSALVESTREAARR